MTGTNNDKHQSRTMLFSYGNYSVALLIFFSQGILYAVLSLAKGVRDQLASSIWLGVFLLLCSFYITPFMLGYAGWYGSRWYSDILFYTPFQQLFLIGPVLYFYTQSLLNQSFKLTGKDILHFLPAAVYFVYILAIFIYDRFIYGDRYFYANGRDKDLDPWYQVAGLISMVIYLSLSLRYYARYRQLAFQELSFAESVLFKWVRHYLLAFLLILILRVLFFILNPEWGNFGRKFWYYLCFSILFFYIAVSGYANSVKTTIAFDDAAEGTMPGPVRPPTIESRTEQKSPEITSEDLGRWKKKLTEAMEQGRHYTNPRLTLADLAEQLGTQPKVVSGVVNKAFGLNFNDFINQYRVDAVLEKMKTGEAQTKTLLAIGLECGFNSKSTFNRAFKKQTQLTPRKYLERISIKS